MDSNTLLMDKAVFYESKQNENLLSEAIFTEIYEKYCKQVYNYMCYRLNNTHTAEELTNDVFIRVIMKYDKFSCQKGAFNIWLFTIAKNVLTDYFRTNRKHNWLSMELAEDYASDSDAPEDIMMKNETNARVLKALHILRDRERNIISLKYGAGLRNTQIAELTGLSEKNVGVILSRSLKKLRKKLEREEHLYE